VVPRSIPTIGSLGTGLREATSEGLIKVPMVEADARRRDRQKQRAPADPLGVGGGASKTVVSGCVLGAQDCSGLEQAPRGSAASCSITKRLRGSTGAESESGLQGEIGICVTSALASSGCSRRMERSKRSRALRLLSVASAWNAASSGEESSADSCCRR